MAIFYYDVDIINKSDQSAVAAAAYNSGESLYAERDEEVKKYRERDVEPEAFILAPSHAPDWVQNREKLWNEVEYVEKQHNAQLARRIILTLPVELSNDDQKDILLRYCQENFVDKGMVADIAIHREHEHNPHAHVLLTMRPFNEDGTWGYKQRKIDGKTVSTTDWNNRENVTKWRGNWAEIQNEKLKERGLDIRVSHESYEKQGLDIMPSKHLGYKSYAIEKKEKEKAEKEGREYQPVTHYGKENIEIAKYNEEVRNLEKEEVILMDEYKKEKETKRQQYSFKISLSPEEKVALEQVRKRVKRYVDYKVALETSNSLENWGRKLERMEREIRAEKNVINRATQVYKSDKDKHNIDYYGFYSDQELFAKQMKDRIGNLQEKVQRLEKEREKYNELRSSVDTVLSLQKHFVDQEFATVYGGRIAGISTIEKYHVLQELKQHNRILNDKELYNFVGGLRSKREGLYDKEVEDAKRSVIVTKLSIRKQDGIHKAALKTNDFDKKYETVKQLEIQKVHQKAFEREFKELFFAKLNEQEKQAFKFTEKHTGNLVMDYSQAEFLQRTISYEENKINRVETELKAEKAILQEIVRIHKNTPEEVKKYGFTVNYFNDEMQDRVSALAVKGQTWKKEKDELGLLKSNMAIVTNVHKNILESEFSKIYGNDLERTMMEKYHLTQEFKKHHELVDVKDYERFFKEKGIGPVREQNNRIEELKRSIVVAGFSIRKQERFKKEAISKDNLDKVYEISKKVKELSLQKDEQQEQFKEYLFKPLNDKEKNAFVTIEQKLDVLAVDYRQVISLQQTIAFQEKQLERREQELKVEKAILQQAVQVHRENPEEVKKYGFTVIEFDQEMKDKITMLTSKVEELKQQKAVFEQLKSDVEIVTSVHEKMLNNEFNQVYGEDPERTMMEKYYLVEEFKQYSETVDKKDYERFFEDKNITSEKSKQLEETNGERIETLRKSISGISVLIRREEQARGKLVSEDSELLHAASKKIESLKLRRNTLHDEYKSLFSEVEQLSSDERKAIETVEKMTGKFILSYQDLQYLERSWNHQDKQLHRDKQEIEAEKTILQQALDAFKVSKRSVAEYGMNPERFDMEFQSKLTELKEKAVEVKEKLNEHEQLRGQLDIVSKVYERSVNKDYNKMFGEQNKDLHVGEKYYHIQAYRLFSDGEEKQENRKQYLEEKLSSVEQPSLYEQVKNLHASIHITELSIRKQERIKEEAMARQDYPTVYQQTKKIQQLHLQKEKLEQDVAPLVDVQKLYLEKQFPQHVAAISKLDGIAVNEIAERVRMKQEHGAKHISFSQELKAYEKEIRNSQDRQQDPFLKDIGKSTLDRLLSALDEASRDKHQQKLKKDRSGRGRRVQQKKLDADLEL